MIINSRVKLFLNQKRFPPLKNSLKNLSSTDKTEPNKNPSVSKPLHQISDFLYIKQKTAVLSIGDAK